jgi:hypothetical protein
MTAPARWYIGRSRTRAWGAASLALLALYAVLVAVEAGRRGRNFAELDPWRLGGGAAGSGLALAALPLALALGWLVPGVSLALLGDRSLAGTRLIGRAFGLGVGYLLATGLGFGLVTGHAPGRAALLVLLALPPIAALLHSDEEHAFRSDWTLLAALLSMMLVTGALWPKLAWEALNGDGTEAYELARSLDRTWLPHWDLERPEPTEYYGHPAVNPFLTNSYFVHGQMVVLGRAELAARVPLVIAVVVAAAAVVGLARRKDPTTLAYVGVLVALSLLWNAYYVGYEPAFADLAEPAATDLFMTALFLAGVLELASGSLALGAAFLLLASGVLYSAPLLASVALVAFALRGGERGRRALRLWTAALALGLAAALAAGLATHSLPDWVRQIRSEYWEDFSDPLRGTPILPLLGRLLLATGALPLAALARPRLLSPLSGALLLACGVYLALVGASQAKSLHYLTPLPFLLAPAALEASQPTWRAAAAGLAALGFVLSWPSPFRIHREAIVLGKHSCLGGVDLEAASLGGDVVYAAFARPGTSERFAVGKHTFARYALEWGGRGCRFRLSPNERQGWVTVAGRALTFSTRDLDEYAAWRFSQPAPPVSLLFPRRPARPLSARPEDWRGRHPLAEAPGRDLLLDGYTRLRSSDPGNPPAYASLRTVPARLLVPVPEGGSVRLRAWAPEGGLVLAQRVNGRRQGDLAFAPGWAELTLPTSARPWLQGWNVLELTGDAASATGLAIDWIDIGAAAP